MLLDNQFEEIKIAIQNYFSPKERVVTTKGKISFVIQVGDNCLEPPRDEVCCCDFGKIETVTNH